MIVRDVLYGAFTINEPILIELIQSPAVQRLKKVAQQGIPDPHYFGRNYSRFEHSVGVMLLLRRLGASIEEQAAGLLHDVSHLAFSHIADFMFGTVGKNNFQDTIHKRFIEKTSIPEILSKYGYSKKRMLDLKNHSLLEQDIPEMCADRVDYALRELFYWKHKSYDLSTIINHNGIITFSNKKTACKFAHDFLMLQILDWGRPRSLALYTFFAETLLYAIKNKVLRKEDFFEKDDQQIITTLLRSGDAKIINVVKSLKKSDSVKIPIFNRVVKTKFRYVNPGFIENGTIKRVMDIDSVFAKRVHSARIVTNNGMKI